MTEIKNYNYSENQITMMLKDDSNGEYLWCGFAQDGSGNCALQKVSAHDPLLTYFDVDLAVTQIDKAVISGSYLYLAFSDATLMGRRYIVANPLSTTVDFTTPAGITEYPVDILINTHVYFLIPGVDSGTNTKIVQYTISGTYTQTIDLSTVTNAKAFCVDENDEIRVVTYQTPAEIVRVYDLATTPQYTITDITD